ncbi:hypothetical protein [Burkholderia cenocepacia]|uniref:hypothetical protein n=1 Tax=Burkholderia cenocepacia TaxID=95486 RepID=UPI00114D3BFF|nr:hypothetical protein [Burkholderia cenocepacia]
MTTDTRNEGAVDSGEQIAAEPAPLAPPRLGEQIAVVAGAGRVVINREFGGLYSVADTSLATVNLRILRLLDDGDLIRQPIG